MALLLLCLATLGLAQEVSWEPPLDPESADQVAAMLHGADLVAIGEVIHTSGGLLDMRSELGRLAITELGSRLILWESPWQQAAAVQQYLTQGDCEADAARSTEGLFGVYADVSTAQLLRVACRWNREHPDDQVEVAGIDIDRAETQVPTLLFALEGEVPRLDVCPTSKTSDALSVRSSADPLAPFPELDLPACRDRLDALRKDLERAGRFLGPPRKAWIGQQARLEMVERTLKVGERGAYEARDEAMAEITLLTVAERYRPGTGPILLFAHDGHIARNQSSDALRFRRGHAARPFTSLGELLAASGRFERLVTVSVTAYWLENDWRPPDYTLWGGRGLTALGKCTVEKRLRRRTRHRILWSTSEVKGRCGLGGTVRDLQSGFDFVAFDRHARERVGPRWVDFVGVGGAVVGLEDGVFRVRYRLQGPEDTVAQRLTDATGLAWVEQGDQLLLDGQHVLTLEQVTPGVVETVQDVR